MALKNMGFEEYPQKGTSHQHWKKIVRGQLLKVTVDCPQAPFSKTLVASMAKQAGVSKNTFLAYCNDKKLREDPHL